MITMKADESYMDLYIKKKTFFIFYKSNMFIVNNKNYRKLSKKEIVYLSNWALQEVESGIYIYEEISKVEVLPKIFFSKDIESFISKKIQKKYKKELIKIFKEKYLLKIKSSINKNNDNLNFINIHNEVLADMVDLLFIIDGKEDPLLEYKNLNKINEMIFKYLEELINWYGFLYIGKKILKNKKGEFKIYNKKNRNKKLIKIIKDRDR